MTIGMSLISLKQLQRDLTLWIEGFYNRERRYSTIGYQSYQSPIDDEQRPSDACTLTPAAP